MCQYFESLKSSVTDGQTEQKTGRRTGRRTVLNFRNTFRQTREFFKNVKFSITTLFKNIS